MLSGELPHRDDVYVRVAYSQIRYCLNIRAGPVCIQNPRRKSKAVWTTTPATGRYRPSVSHLQAERYYMAFARWRDKIVTLGSLVPVLSLPGLSPQFKATRALRGNGLRRKCRWM